MPFDPNKPFEPLSGNAPSFDPSQPFEPVAERPGLLQRAGSVIATAVDDGSAYIGAGMENQRKIDAVAADQIAAGAPKVLAPTARFAAPIGGFVLGGVPGAVMGGMIGQQIGDALERPDDALSLAQMRRDVGAGIVGGMATAMPMPPAITKPGLNLLRQFGAGAATGAATAAAYDSAVDGKIDFSNLLASGAIGSMLGLVNGTQQNADTRAWLVNEIRRTTPFKAFEDTAKDRWQFSNWLADRQRARERAQNRQGAVDVEASAPGEPLPGLPEAPAESALAHAVPEAVVPVPEENLTQGRSMVDRLAHTEKVADSTSAPAPIMPEPTAAPAAEPEPAPEAVIAEAPPAQENAELNPTEPSAPVAEAPASAPAELVGPSLLEFGKSKLPPAIAEKITDERQVESFRAQWEKERAALADVATSAPAEPVPAAVEPPAQAALNAKASEVFKRVLSAAPEGDTLWHQQQHEQIGNPNRYHPVREDENPKGLNIGDVVTVQGTDKFPEPYSGIVATVQKTSAKAYKGGYQVKVVVPKPGNYGGFVGIGRVSKGEAAPEAPAQAIVAATPAGPAIAPKPTEDRRVAKLADKKRLVVQKEFLLDAVQAAADAAPSSPEFVADMAELQKRKKRMGDRLTWQSPPEEAAFNKKYGDYITIHVPDDGTYRIRNIKEALTEFAAKVETKFGRGLKSPVSAGATAPKLTPAELAQHRVKTPGTSGVGMPGYPVSPALPAPPPGTTMGTHRTVMPVTMQPVTDQTIAMRGVMDALENIMRVLGLQTPIRHGRMAQRNALGVFKTWSEVIRNRQEGDIPTAAHEVAHAASKRLFGSVMSKALLSAIPFKPIAKELQTLGRALYGSARPAAGYTAEGFSELVRLWLTTEDAAKHAPQATAWLENTLFMNQPVFGAAMQQARDKIDIWRGQGALERMNQQTAREPGIVKRATAAVKSALGKRTLVEEFAPLEELAEGYEKITGRALPSSENPALIAQAYRRTSGAVLKQWVEDGVTDIAGNQTGPSLREAYARLKPADEEPFHSYLFAKQALIRHDQGKFAGIERADAEWIVKQLETPAYVDAASKIAEWWQAVRDYKREAYPAKNGAMLDAIEKANPVYYGPLAAFRDQAKVRKAASTALGGGLYRFTGHGGPTKRLYEQSLLVAENIIGSAQRDLVLRSIVQLGDVEGLGWLVEPVPVAKVMEQVNVEKLRKQIEAWGVDMSHVPPETLLEFATQMDEPKGSDPIIAVREQTGVRPDGSPIMQTRWLQIPREVQEIIQGVHEPERLGPIFELLIGGPTRMFKLGTTGLRAGFSLITNPERDAQTFMMQSISSNPAEKTAALLGAYKELVQASLTGNPGPYLQLFHQMGVSGANFLGGDIAQAKREAKGLFHGKFFKVWSSPVENLREALSFTESAPRLAELKLAANHFGWKPGQPLSLRQAVQIRLAAKRVTTDFSAKGGMPSMLQRGGLGPFFNASVQGARAYGRSFKGDQGTFRRNRAALIATLNALTMITLPLLWNWWANRDKEWYRALPWRERFLYINIEAGMNVIQIPLPQEWGVSFGVLPIAAIDSLWKRDPRAVEEALKHAFALLNPVDWPVPMAALKEQWQNKVDFFNRPIIPRSEIDLLPGAQRGPYTSWLAKTLGDAFPTAVSPRRVDAAIREVFGGAAADYSRSPELLMKALGLKIDPRQMEMADAPVIGRQFRRGGVSSEANQHLTDFWDDQSRYGAQLASATRDVKQGQPVTLAMTQAEQNYAKALNTAAPYIALTMRIGNATPDVAARQKIYRAAGEIAAGLVANRPQPSPGVSPLGAPKSP